MQLKINFLCRDSILAAPIVLDSALFLDLAKRAGMHGIQEWLSFYFKSPMHAPEALPGARSVHSADEAEEHAAVPEGRGADHAPRPRVLRLDRRYVAAGADRRRRHGRAVGAADHLRRQRLLLPVGRLRRRGRRLSASAEPHRADHARPTARWSGCSPASSARSSHRCCRDSDRPADGADASRRCCSGFWTCRHAAAGDPRACSNGSAAAAPAAPTSSLGQIFGLMFWLFVGGVFSTLGGLLGAAIFKKQTPARRDRYPRDLAGSRLRSAARHCALLLSHFAHRTEIWGWTGC